MGLQCAVCFQLSTTRADGLHYNHVFVTGGKKEYVCLNKAANKVLSLWTSYDMKVAVQAFIKTHRFLEQRDVQTG